MTETFVLRNPNPTSTFRNFLGVPIGLFTNLIRIELIYPPFLTTADFSGSVLIIHTFLDLF